MCINLVIQCATFDHLIAQAFAFLTCAALSYSLKIEHAYFLFCCYCLADDHNTGIGNKIKLLLLQNQIENVFNDKASTKGYCNACTSTSK
jgi:hypothetical protein